MTRPTRSDLSKRLSALDNVAPGSRTVEAWLREHFDTADGALLRFRDDSPSEDSIHAATDGHHEIYVSAGDVPEWVDTDTLPIELP